MTSPNELGMPLKDGKEVRVGIYRTQIRPNEQDIVASCLMFQDVKTVGTASDWLIGDTGMVI